MQNYIVGFDEDEIVDRIMALGHKTPTEIFDHLSDADLSYLNEETQDSVNLVAFLAMVSFADFMGVNRPLTELQLQAVWSIVSIDLIMESDRRIGYIELVQGPWPPESFFTESGRALFQRSPALRNSGRRTKDGACGPPAIL